MNITTVIRNRININGEVPHGSILNCSDGQDYSFIRNNNYDWKACRELIRQRINIYINFLICIGMTLAYHVIVNLWIFELVINTQPKQSYERQFTLTVIDSNIFVYGLSLQDIFCQWWHNVGSATEFC